MSKETDLINPIKRRISWIAPENDEDIIKMESIKKLPSLTFRELARLRDYIDYILEVVAKNEQKDAILTIIFACTYYDPEILKFRINELIILTETLMYMKVIDYPDYETILQILSERSVTKNENRRI